MSYFQELKLLKGNYLEKYRKILPLDLEKEFAGIYDLSLPFLLMLPDSLRTDN